MSFENLGLAPGLLRAVADKGYDTPTAIQTRAIPAMLTGRDVLVAKCAKRNVDVRFLDFGAVQKIGGDKVKQSITVRHGVSSDHAKKIVRLIKDSKSKVQASIQGDAVRVSGAKRDDLQSAIALLKKEITDVPLSFTNFRE